MVKQAEKFKKRNPLLPIFGFVIAAGLFALAYGLVTPAVLLLDRVTSNVLPWPPPKDNDSLERLAIAFGMWLVFLVIAYAFVAIATGKDPNSPKDIQMPPRTKEERDRRY